MWAWWSKNRIENEATLVLWLSIMHLTLVIHMWSGGAIKNRRKAQAWFVSSNLIGSIKGGFEAAKTDADNTP